MYSLNQFKERWLFGTLVESSMAAMRCTSRVSLLVFFQHLQNPAVVSSRLFQVTARSSGSWPSKITSL